MASSIVELNFGIYNDIKYLFNPYCNTKSTDNANTYTLLAEQWTGQQDYNLVEESLTLKNVLFKISNTELLNTRIVADISNNANDLLVDYTVGALIPSLDNYNLIKIGASRYLYSSPSSGYASLGSKSSGKPYKRANWLNATSSNTSNDKKSSDDEEFIDKDR